ncbi:MAG: hypothetical protein AB7O45_05660 [Alphaproteobacteria bacterium]
MRASPADLALAAAIAVLLAGASAIAQTGPTPLVPPAVRTAPPAPGIAPTPLPQERAAPLVRPGGVTARPLPSLDLESAGWTERERGLGAGLWQGSRWSTVERVLALVPPPVTPARHDLARRLLMSAAARPEDAPPGRVIERRLERLLAIGDARSAHALAGAVPAARLDGPRARLAAEAALLAGAPADACKRAGSDAVDLADLFWRRLRIACDAIDGRADQAALGLLVLREENKDPGEGFVALAEAIAGRAEPRTLAAAPDAILLALGARAGAKLSDAALAAAGPAVATAIAHDQRWPVGQRLAAGERAAAHGLVDGPMLAALYAELPVAADALADPRAAAEADKGPAARAAIVQGARLQIVPARRLEVLALGWRHALADGAALAYAGAVAPMVEEITPSADLAPHAGAAIRILLGAGRAGRAARWLAVVGARPGDETAMAAHAAAAPLVRLARGEEGPAWNADAVRRWTAGMGGDGDPRAAIGLALLAALGDLAASDAWLALATPAPTPVPSTLWFAQEAAAREARLGEQVALALAILGERAVPHPLASFSALNGLRLAERTPEARRLAVEIALLAGI